MTQRRDNSKSKTHVGFENPLLNLLLCFVSLECSGIYLLDEYYFNEWFYAGQKDDEHIDSSYNVSAGRDITAYSATESFRKKYMKGPPYTKKFLNTIIANFKVFGPYSDWDHFEEVITKPYLQFCERYNAMQINLVKKNYFEINGIVNFGHSFLFAMALYRIMVRNSNVLSPYDGLPLVGFGTRNREVRCALHSEFDQMDSLENVNRFPYKLYGISRLSLMKNEHAGLFVATNKGRVIDSITLIPLNTKGLDHLYNEVSFSFDPLFDAKAKGFISHLSDDFLWSSNNFEDFGCFILQFGSLQGYGGMLVEFEFYIADLVEKCLGEHYTTDVLIFISTDSPDSRRFINLYDLIPIKYDLLCEYLNLTKTSKGYGKLETVNYSFYYGTLSDLMEKDDLQI